MYIERGRCIYTCRYAHRQMSQPLLVCMCTMCMHVCMYMYVCIIHIYRDIYMSQPFMVCTCTVRICRCVLCVCVCVYIYIYIYTHKYEHACL